MRLTQKSLLLQICLFCSVILFAQPNDASNLEPQDSILTIKESIYLKVKLNNGHEFKDSITNSTQDSLYFSKEGAIAKSSINSIKFNGQDEAYQKFKIIYWTACANLMAFGLYSTFSASYDFGSYIPLILLASSPIWALAIPITAHIAFNINWKGKRLK